MHRALATVEQVHGIREIIRLAGGDGIRREYLDTLADFHLDHRQVGAAVADLLASGAVEVNPATFGLIAREHLGTA